MAKHLEIGKRGEDIACKYLSTKKYRILKRNYREKFDEIDVIARSFDGILVFCEVKTLNTLVGSEYGMMPEDNLTKDKLRKIIRACTLFSAKHPELVNEEKGWRLDLVAIVLDEDKIVRISHYENINST